MLLRRCLRFCSPCELHGAHRTHPVDVAAGTFANLAGLLATALRLRAMPSIPMIRRFDSHMEPTGIHLSVFGHAEVMAPLGLADSRKRAGKKERKKKSRQ